MRDNNHGTAWDQSQAGVPAPLAEAMRCDCNGSFIDASHGKGSALHPIWAYAIRPYKMRIALQKNLI